MTQAQTNTPAAHDTIERKFKWGFAFLSFLVAMIVYGITMAPTLSFWDCGEFIASANILGIPHPPGTPFYIVIARAAIIIFGFLPDVAARMNLISVITASLAVTCGFLIAWESLIYYLGKQQFEPKLRRFILTVGSLTAAFLVLFSDTLWFSAVEAETYTFAMFILFAMILLAIWWTPRRDTAMGDKILLLLVYMAYCGNGIQIFCLLYIPIVFAYVLIMQPRLRKINAWPFWVFPPLLFSAAVKIDIFGASLLFTLFVSGIMLLLVKKENKYPVRLSFWTGVIVLIGYSSHAYIPIRTLMNPDINESAPEVHSFSDVIQIPFLDEGQKTSKFEDFIARKQYIQSSMQRRAMYRRGDVLHQAFSFAHLGYGGYQLAQYFPWKVGAVQYPGGSGRDTNWVVSSNENYPNRVLGHDFRTQMEMFFPGGRESTRWQNYVVPVVLVLTLNALLLWILWQLYRRHKGIGILLASVYLISSAALVWYLNMADGTRHDSEIFIQYVPKIVEQFKAANGHSPSNAELGEVLSRYPVQQLEVRERDYFYTPAYMMMGVILGIGLSIGLFELARRRERLNLIKPLGIGATILAMAVPAASNWHRNDRSHNYTPWDFAWNFLNSTEKDGILFTFGDNDTFPLWALQEAWNIRKDLRIVNTSLGQTDWYIKQMMSQDPKINLVFFKDPATMERVEKGEPHPAGPYIALAKQTLDTLNGIESFLAKPEVIQAQASNSNPGLKHVADSLTVVLKNRSFEKHVWQSFYESMIFPDVAQIRETLPMITMELARIQAHLADPKIDSLTRHHVQDTLDAMQAQLQLGQKVMSRIYESKDSLIRDSAQLVGRLMILRDSLSKDSNPSMQKQMEFSMLKEEAQTVVTMLHGAHEEMGTDQLLILDVVLHNPNRPIHFAMGGTSIGLDNDLISVGWVRTLRRGSELNQQIAWHKTDSLINNVFKYRSLGDESFLSSETIDQMWGMHFNTLVGTMGRPYLEARRAIGINPQQMPLSTPLPNLPPQAQAYIQHQVSISLPYFERLNKLFPSKPESYLFTAEAQALNGQMDKAKATLDACVQNTSESKLCSDAVTNLHPPINLGQYPSAGSPLQLKP